MRCVQSEDNMFDAIVRKASKHHGLSAFDRKTYIQIMVLIELAEKVLK